MPALHDFQLNVAYRIDNKRMRVYSFHIFLEHSVMKRSGNDKLAPQRKARIKELRWIKTKALMRVVQEYSLPPSYKACAAGIPAELEIIVAWAICWGYRTSPTGDHERCEEETHDKGLILCQPLTDVWARLGSQLFLPKSDLQLPVERKTNPEKTSLSQRKQYREVIRGFYINNDELLGGLSGNIRPNETISSPFTLFERFYRELRKIEHADWNRQAQLLMECSEELCNHWAVFSTEFG